MILQILGCGTSTGVPVPGCKCAVCLSGKPLNQRLRTSALLKVRPDFNILIDASTDLRQQALRWNVDLVNAVLLTHAHADHILGMDDLRVFNFVIKQSLPCYGSQFTLDRVRETFPYIFQRDPDYQGGAIADLDLHRIDDLSPFEVGGLRIQPFPLLHGKVPVLGFRFGDLAYATDCISIPDVSLDILKGVRYLVLDGLRYKPHRTHMSIPQAIEYADRIGAEKTWFTHMTHTVDYDEVSAQLPSHVALAWDGLEIEW